MKIVLTVHQFLPDHSSGTEILTYLTAKELMHRGHEVIVVTGYHCGEDLPPEKRFDEYVHDGIRVLRFYHGYVPFAGQTVPNEMEYNSLFLGNWFEGVLKDWQPDIVHMFHLGLLSASTIDACDRANVPRVMTTTDFWLVCLANQLRLPDGSLCKGPNLNSLNCIRHIMESSQSEPLKKRLRAAPDWIMQLFLWAVKFNWLPERWYTKPAQAVMRRQQFLGDRMNKLNRVLVPTRLMKSTLQRYGLEPERTVYLPYGLNLEHIQPTFNKGQFEPLRVGYIGTLYEHKGPHLLVDAVKNHLPDVKLTLDIYGKLSDYPDYVAKLKDIAQDDSRIHFKGTFPNAEIGNVLAGLDVLIVPSIWYENTPLVIYSAQAAACPVIGTNVGGIAEAITHEENGLLFELGNVAELAGAIRRLASDRTFLTSLSKAARRPTTIQQYVDALEDIYAECV
ncbi:glycosyltransferase family 4 protein [Oscillatoria sp. CS-180]|uniref:glycosyltransferase family 4 protein n=1 Tax=Oscillatoria sp. CS-180 TaxID=3021720 RepID=UPI00232BBE50|nr:glycosyltransferase family 4 protein [Oscillatoria sp. CS-180]MDB9527017.1 glycosyltransferase family 4 protein [Oscillatoria sp. CS-180]